MRVLLFSTQWPEYMISLANEVATRCETVLIMPNNYGLTDVHISCLKPNVRLRTFRFIDYKSLRANARMIFQLLKILWEEQPNILHVQSNGFRLFYLVAFFKPFKTRIVNTIHDPEKHAGDLSSLAVDDSLVIYLLRFLTKKYVVHGENLVGELSTKYRVPLQKIISIPHGHFEIYKKFQSARSHDDGSHVLFFGRIWPYKGLDHFIEAANIVHKTHANAKFCIAGCGEDIDRYLSLIQNKGCFNILNYRIPLEEVGPLFDAAVAVVLPYIEATQSGVIPLAYAYAKPVIATRVGGLPNVVMDCTTGFLVDPGSAKEIAEKIMHLIGNPEDRKRMGDEAYKFAHTRLSWKNIADETVKMYSSIE